MSLLEDMRSVLEKCEALMARDDVRKSSAYFAIISTPPCPTCKHKPEYREGPPETIVMCDHFIAELKRKCPERVASSSMGEFTLGIDGCGFVVERADA